MNILLITNFGVGFMVSEIPRVSVFGHCPYSVTFPYIYSELNIIYLYICIELDEHIYSLYDAQCRRK